ncbi:MAG: dihydrolipoyl dehydrogenase [Bacteriovoracales bacterium]|nr:dihydrolipoyl dehydrogenase [Bacteriovoracales bacterium]
MSEQHKYDVIVIGSGPGGYVCAIRCAQLGLRTAVIEKYPTLGGTCLNVGCIPSKAWLDSSERFDETKHLGLHGILAKEVELDFDKMRERVKKVVASITKGVEFLMKKNKITRYEGMGSLKGPRTVHVEGPDGGVDMEAKFIVIATGSKPASLPGVSIDKERIITSTEALSLPQRPNDMVVIGGGAIGLEMGQVFCRLGTKVTVVEYADRLLPTMDHALGAELMKALKKKGMEFHLKTSVESVENRGKTTVLQAKTQKGETLELQGDYTLVAVGRRPYTEGLELEAIGVGTDERGRVVVDEHLRTSVSSIYAIGDVIQGPMLAHKAEEEGVFVAEHLAGQKPHLSSDLIPAVVYTWPEVAAVGRTEEELKALGLSYKTGIFPFKASGRARASEESGGLIKVLSDAKTDEILGVHMIGPRCADMIAEAVVAMEYRASAEDIGRICHPHPTFTEAFKEAALDASEKRAFHI